jgi:hypothetical protein
MSVFDPNATAFLIVSSLIYYRKTGSIIAMKIYGCLNLIVVMFYLWQSSYVICDGNTPSDKLPYLQNR